jgi:nucleoid DNA-binding protein
MNKGDLVSDAAKRANLPASTVEAALNGLLESIGEAVERRGTRRQVKQSTFQPERL